MASLTSERAFVPSLRWRPRLSFVKNSWTRSRPQTMSRANVVLRPASPARGARSKRARVRRSMQGRGTTLAILCSSCTAGVADVAYQYREGCMIEPERTGIGMSGHSVGYLASSSAQWGACELVSCKSLATNALNGVLGTLQLFRCTTYAVSHFAELGINNQGAPW